jgi:L-malate glycosyltransferase
MTYRQAIIKKRIEYILIFPIVLIGKIVGLFLPLKDKRTVFLFFPNADIGGSIKVNAEITAVIKDKKPVIIFSKKPHNNEFLPQYLMKGVKIINFYKYIDNKLYHFVNIFFRGVITSWINKSDNPVIFGGECIYFYKIIPHVKKETKIIELCHVSRWINYTQAFINDIDVRIFSTQLIKREVEEQYIKNNLPKTYFDKLLFVDNKIDRYPFAETNNPLLEVVFIGRGAAQKRVHLVGAINKKIHDLKAKAHFSYVGDVEESVPINTMTYATFYGPVKDKEKLNEIYNQSDVLILTSAFEGLPIVVMEMMARGKIVLSTAVSGIPDYVKHKETGLLIFETEEDKIVDTGVNLITELIENSTLKKQLERNSYEFASQKFDADFFDNTYNKLFENQMQPGRVI